MGGWLDPPREVTFFCNNKLYPQSHDQKDGNLMNFLTTVWDFFLTALMVFVFIAYLMALFAVITDLFRDRSLSGWAKAIWLIFLVFMPFLTVFVYLIARGKGMGQREAQRAQAAQIATDDYIRSVVNDPASPASEIAQAKKLLDQGTISKDEFESLKNVILQGKPQ